MAFGFVILLGLLLIVAALAGLGYYGIPVAIVLVGALGFLFANRLKKTGGPGEGTSPGHDDPGGETHQREGYAHTGQATMTPEQMKRART